MSLCLSGARRIEEASPCTRVSFAALVVVLVLGADQARGCVARFADLRDRLRLYWSRLGASSGPSADCGKDLREVSM